MIVKGFFFCFLLIAITGQLRGQNFNNFKADTGRNKPAVIKVRKNGTIDTANYVRDTVVKNEPSYNLFLEQLVKRIQRTVIYPAKAKENDIEGIVLLSFIVNETGQLNQYYA